MTSLILTNEVKDLPHEIFELETQLAVRQDELNRLQIELRDFKTRYTEIVGSRLAELAEVELEIKKVEAVSEIDEDDAADFEVEATPNLKNSMTAQPLRKIFWSIAKLFHPDYAADDVEAERRHRIMAEATRAYAEGDAERLNDILDDDTLQSYCVSTHTKDAEDLATRLVNLKEQLRTVEYGIKRVKFDALYKMKLASDKDALHGRDTLAEMCARIKKQIVQTRRRLEQLEASA